MKHKEGCSYNGGKWMEQTEIFSYLQSDVYEMQREGAFMAGEAMCLEAIPTLAELLTSPNLGVQDAADMSLRKIGGKHVVDAVIPMLRSEEASVRNLSMDILRQIGNQNIEPIIALLQDEDPDIRIFSSDILGSTQTYTPVYPLCQALLHDPEVNVRYQAAVSLGELAKPEAIDALNNALDDDDWVKFAVIEALMKIRDDSSITALMGALESSSELVSSIIVDALGEMGSIKAVPVLIKSLDGSAPVLRNKIVKAVVNIMGTKTLSFLSDDDVATFSSDLFAAADDEDKGVQDAAIAGLSCVGGAEASRKILLLAATMDRTLERERFHKAVNGLVILGLTPALREGVFSPQESLREVAADVLVRLGTVEAALVCMDVFWDTDRDIQRILARGVGNIAGKEAISFFMRILRESTDGEVLKNALAFLGIRMECADSVGEIIPFLDHPFDDVKEVALEACLAIGGEVVDDVCNEMFHDSDPGKRMMALYAFGKLNVHTHLVELEAALDDDVAHIRKTAMEALAGLCEEMPDLLPRMARRMMCDESREVRRSLVDLLGTSHCPDAVSYLIPALNDEDHWVQIRAIEALGNRGAPELVDLLRPLLTASNPLVPLMVVQALGRIGGKKAFQALLSVLDTEDVELQTAAEQALDKIQAENGEVL